uniref:Presenilin n=1 Tax=Odontella aurita TaxID=265563 RepID=A0A7S4HP42_9STRA
MILAALATVVINTPETMAEYSQGMADAYQFYALDPSSDSKGETLGKSLTNALIIVSVIGGMTFVIVLLYKYRCMKCLIGYMVFSSASLLGLLGAIMLDVAVDKYRIPISKPTFVLLLWNFAAVGVLAIFYQRGIPTWINQSYLVATSVILSWQLSHFDEWTAWTLLTMLAVYDLCAVLTPCGPLKLLVNLMQEDDSPDMPGLLYEAELPQDTPSRNSGPGRGRRTISGMRSGSRSASDVGSGGASGRSNDAGGAAASRPDRLRNHTPEEEEDEEEEEEDEEEATPTTPLTPRTPATASSSRRNGSGTGMEMSDRKSRGGNGNGNSTNGADAGGPPPIPGLGVVAPNPSSGNGASASVGASTPGGGGGGTEGASASRSRPTGYVPLAVAKIYRLAPVDPPSLPEGLAARSGDSTSRPLLGGGDEDGGSSQQQREEEEAPNDALAMRYTPTELKVPVEVFFPANGGRIVTRTNGEGEERYVVLDRNGTEKRTLFLDEEGKVFEEVERRRGGGGGDNDDDSEYEERAGSIKLGLGDFIFYSLMVSKAALYSFATFAACMLVILAGLGGTLVLLAVWKQALPALPISIFLGVTFYLLTRVVIEPWIEDVLRTPLYV